MADRIKLLKFTLSVYKEMGILPKRLDQKRSSLNRQNLTMLIPLVYYLVFGVAFLIFEAKTITEAGISFYTVTTVLGCLTYFLINMLSNMPKIRNIIGNYEEFIKKRILYSGTSTKYNELIENVEKMSKIAHLIFVQLSFIGIASSALLITGINYFIYDLKEKAFYLPFPVMLPFDWTTPVGYAIALIGSFTAIYAVLLGVSPILSFFIGSCWLIVTFAKDVTNDLSQFGAAVLRKTNQVGLEMRFCNVIRQLSDTKQFVNDFNSIYEIIITYHFVWSLSNIGSTLLVLQTILSQPNPDPIQMITPSILVTWSFFLLFFYCESGQFVMNQFDEFDDELAKCGWYLFPVKMQKMLVTVMSNTQQPVFIHGLADAMCTREIFKKTTKGGFSYFMTLRSFVN